MALVEHPTNALSQMVFGAGIEVHRALGPGLLESCYHACLCRELDLRKLSYRSKVALPIEYKGIPVARGYVVDLLIADALVVELKAVDKLLPVHSAQLVTYMRLLKLSAGLLMNFNVPLLPKGLQRILL